MTPSRRHSDRRTTLKSMVPLAAISDRLFSRTGLRVQQHMPATDLLAAHLAHVVPVRRLLLAGRLGSQREPADGLLLLHAPLVVHRDEQRHVGQLEQRDLPKCHKKCHNTCTRCWRARESCHRPVAWPWTWPLRAGSPGR